ncbi:IS110 family RNA-guided transposase [Nocardia tengchongensis]|uniref:IS110 family transposase n=1 Tax=Nocardia tengchongensis TaxID=2055889 RepID=UPI0036595613
MTDRVWVGVDVGKIAHHCIVVDSKSRVLLSLRARNAETELMALVDSVTAIGTPVTWTVDQLRGHVALLLAVLRARDQPVTYLPGKAFHHAAHLYRSEQKSDAKDALVIADHARSHPNLRPICAEHDSTVALRVLLTRRVALAEERVRAINRLRRFLAEISPELEAEFNLANSIGALHVLSRYPSHRAIQATTPEDMNSLLPPGIRHRSNVIERACTAARGQSIIVPGHDAVEMSVAASAKRILHLQTGITVLETSIGNELGCHPYGDIVLSMPGFGTVLAAEFVVGIGGTLDNYANSGRLAAACGLAPVARDSGKIVRNYRRPQHYSRQLARSCYLASQAAVRSGIDARSVTYYQRKRAEGKRHKQAVISLARRRITVLWVMLRDGIPYRPLDNPGP